MVTLVPKLYMDDTSKELLVQGLILALLWQYEKALEDDGSSSALLLLSPKRRIKSWIEKSQPVFR